MCFKPNYFQLEYIYVNAFKTKRFLKCFVDIYIYIYEMVIVITKRESDFKKWDLQRTAYLRMTVIRFVSSSLWSGTMAELGALVSVAVIWHWIFLGMKPDHMLGRYKIGENGILDNIHAKVGDIYLCILGWLFTIMIEMVIAD